MKAITGDLYTEFSEYAGYYLLNSANTRQMPAGFSKMLGRRSQEISRGKARAGDVGSI